MYDLREKIESIIEEEIEINKQTLLDHDWCDSIARYDRQIVEALEEYLETEIPYKSELWHRVTDWITDNSEQTLIYVEAGFPYVSKNQYAIAPVGEIEVDLSHHFPFPITPKKREAINRYTYLCVADSGYGYIIADYDFIAIDMDAIPLNEIKEDIAA